MNLKIYQVDAFSNKVFGGNPAAVCILDEWMEDELLQKIAEENNLSETAFAVRQGEKWNIRWYTPRTEVDLCGHATLATAFVIFNHTQPDLQKIHFYSDRSGDLYVSREKDLITMDFPKDELHEVENNFVLNQALGRAPTKTFRGKSDYLLIYDSEEDIRHMTPDFNALGKIDARGVIISSPSTEVDFVSRFFGPKVGIDEDPVTGSAHTTLVPYWTKRLNKSEMQAKQLSERGGEIFCEDLEERVKISGQAQLYMIGEIFL